ncbi:unnamed protein product [Protopolystoma xenopodis]|uniref:Uncharacterized protein n=1 Tax=Protopolystoma xenopodis TaxID=117903 RepID=A0A3S5ARK0_9PLAT|nr:unnamed protein product [Protopolystoma xenopodis]
MQLHQIAVSFIASNRKYVRHSNEGKNNAFQAVQLTSRLPAGVYPADTLLAAGSTPPVRSIAALLHWPLVERRSGISTGRAEQGRAGPSGAGQLGRTVVSEWASGLGAAACHRGGAREGRPRSLRTDG